MYVFSCGANDAVCLSVCLSECTQFLAATRRNVQGRLTSKCPHKMLPDISASTVTVWLEHFRGLQSFYAVILRALVEMSAPRHRENLIS